MTISLYESLLKNYRADMMPGKKINEDIAVTLSGEDAAELLQLLSMAGIQSTAPQEIEVELDEQTKEQSPNWPTKPETFQDTPTLSSYSGGLNKPKTTGQSTVPVIASQKDRQYAHESIEEEEDSDLMILERSLFKLYQDYKGKE